MSSGSATRAPAGIPPEEQTRLFAPFWQSNPADRRGVGLGLAVSRGLIEAHGGRIWVESAVGSGTTFFFSLPQRSALPDAAALP